MWKVELIIRQERKSRMRLRIREEQQFRLGYDSSQRLLIKAHLNPMHQHFPQTNTSFEPKPQHSVFKAVISLYILIHNSKVERMILSSKECLIISSQENREFFLFDPKTTAVLHKYRDDCFLSSLAYYTRSQQILGQQINKTFVNVWSYDSQEAQLRVSMNETMTSLVVSEDNHYFIGGGITGNLYVWELPNGILIKKKMVHSTEVKHVLQYENHHVITASKNEVKIWPLSSFFIEVDHSSALKTYTSVLDIISIGLSRNILAVLTHKSVSFLQLSLRNTTKELVLIHKIDYEYVTTLCLSNTSAFIGDAKGTIQVIELITSEQQRSDLSFKIKQGTKQLQISKPKRKRVLTGGSKHPITTLAYVQTLSYLISGHSSGEIIVWSNHEIKKSLHLFKTSITHIKVVFKPKQQKIHQSSKLQPLNKYELSKEQELLDIVPNYSYDSDFLQTPVAPSAFENGYEAQEQKILYNMLSILNEPQKLLREQVLRLKQQRRMLMQSNLHYFKLLSE